jgi:lactococcin 972 family bacteriocin
MNISKGAATFVTGAVLAAGLATPAMAAITTSYVGGGTWKHGTADGKVVSNFYHGGRYHKSSVQPSGGSVYSSGCTRPGAWSYASANDTWWVDKAYYAFCD